MPLFLTDEQTMLRAAAQGFIAGEAPVAHRRALRDAGTEGFSRPLWARFAEMGFAGVLVPEAKGGAGLGLAEVCVVLEEIGRNLTPSPFLATAVGAGGLPIGAGIATGETVVALAIDEGGRHRPERIATTAVPAGDGWWLTGIKTFVTDGDAADLLLVAARDPAGAVRLFAVKCGAEGVSIDTERLADASHAATVRLTDAAAEAVGDAAEFERLLDRVRIGAAAEMLGVGSAAMAMTIGYLKERKQFGRIIGSFQGLQHRAAHLYAELEVARAAVMKAAQLYDAGDDGATRAALVAKAMAGLACGLAVREGVQMHGGIGMTDVHDIGLFMKRARVLDTLFGDSDDLADRLARLAGY